MSAKKSLILSTLISLVIALIVEHRVLLDTTAINDDVRNQIYWMARLIDTNYFPNDYIAEYFTQSSLISPILSWIYQIFTNLADPKIISQFLLFPIVALTTFFLFKATELYAGASYAFWISFVFNLYIWTQKYLSGGLPRSFFYFLFFLFLWLLAKKDWRWLIACFILQALIYPTAFFVSIVTLAVEIIWCKMRKENISNSEIKALWFGLISGLIVFYFRFVRYPIADKFGSMPGLKEAVLIPNFYIDGKTCVFIIPFKFTQIHSLRELVSILQGFNLDGIAKLIFYILLIVIIYWVFIKVSHRTLPSIKTPQYLWTSSIASIILFVTAHFVLFYLYLPHRYPVYILPLIPIFLLGSLLHKIQITNPRKPMIVCLALILLIMIAKSYWREDLIHIKRAEKLMHQFLETTPKDSVIVAPLAIANNIPVFAYRSVLVNSETNIPFHTKYYEEIKLRLDAVNQIYNSQNIDKISEVIRKYSVDYIVLDSKSKENKEFRILKNMINSSVVYANNRFTVIKLVPR